MALEQKVCGPKRDQTSELASEPQPSQHFSQDLDFQAVAISAGWLMMPYQDEDPDICLHDSIALLHHVNFTLCHGGAV